MDPRRADAVDINSLQRMALLTFAVALLVPVREARAFCIARTCNPLTETCARDEHDCVVDGMPLFWGTEEVSVRVDPRGSMARGISAEQTESVLSRALDRWTSVDCPAGGTPSIGLSVSSAHADGVVAYVDDGWPYNPKIAAFTGLVIDLNSGEILESELSINSDDHDFAVEATGRDEVDLEAVLTHEIGHLLGLDHSDVPGTTMAAVAEETAGGELLTLEADDVAAICTLYPPAAEPSDGDAGAASPQGMLYEEPGCTIIRSPTSGDRGLCALAAVFLAMGARAGRRRPRAAFDVTVSKK
jgi:hypothetical protein